MQPITFILSARPVELFNRVADGETNLYKMITDTAIKDLSVLIAAYLEAGELYETPGFVGNPQTFYCKESAIDVLYLLAKNQGLIKDSEFHAPSAKFILDFMGWDYTIKERYNKIYIHIGGE